MEPSSQSLGIVQIMEVEGGENVWLRGPLKLSFFFQS